MTNKCPAAAIFCFVAGLVSGSAPASAQQYSVVLAGTVDQVGASAVDVVPPSEGTMTVKVLRVLMPMWQSIIAPMDLVTIQLDAKAVFHPGEPVLLFGDGWIYADNVALRGIVRPATQEALEATIAEIDNADEPQFTDQPTPVSVASSSGSSEFAMSSTVAGQRAAEDPKPSSGEEKQSPTPIAVAQEEGTITAVVLDAMQRALERRDLRKRVFDAHMIIEGQITKIAPLSDKHRRLLRTRLTNGEVPISEHEAQWAEAEIRVKSILKGSLAQKIVVFFPQQTDIRWTHSPRFVPRQIGVFFLHEQQILELESPDGIKLMGSTQEPATSLDRRDYLSPEFTDRIREIVAGLKP